MSILQNPAERRTRLSADKLAMLEKRLRAIDQQGPADSILRRASSGPAPLSYGQQRLWFLDQLSPGNPFYNMSSASRLRARIIPGVLERAVNEIVRRHEVLRTTFQIENGQPRQVIGSTCHVPLKIIDLRHVPIQNREAEAARLAAEEANRAFDLVRGPLLRCCLIEIVNDDVVFIVTIHHSVSDGWSLSIFGRELQTIYTALAAGWARPLPELTIQYSDFAVWQRDRFAGVEFTRQLEFWRRRLQDLPTLALYTDHPRPKNQSFQGGAVAFALAPSIAKQLKDLGGRTGCTSFMVLLAAFVALLHRYTGQEDLVVGTPVSNRGRTELEQLIGMFVNTLVMRLDAAGNPTFRTLLARVRETALSAYAHQELPFEKLVEELHPQRDLSRNPLFQVTFQLFSSPDETTGPRAGGGQPDLCSDRASAVFDLAFNLWETAETITGQIEYSTDLFERETVEAMSAHFVKLIESAVECPHRHISELSLLSKADLHMIVTEWNSTAADYPRDATVHGLFEDQVLRTPDAIAARFNGGSLSYAELNEKADRLARHLRGIGIRRGSRVALCLRRSGGMLAGLFGILKAGAAYVPLDPSYPAARLGFMLSDSEADVVVTDDHCAESVRDHKRVIRISDAGDVQATADCQDQSAADHATAGDIAYIIYTSGSTGTPKGVQIRHRSLVNYLTWCIREYDVASGDGSLVHSSIAFDLTITGLFAPLLAGKPVLLINDADPSVLAQAVRERRDLSLIKITPPHLKVLSHEIPAVESAGRTRAFIVGGENLLATDIAFWRRWAPETALVNEYGPTETTVGCCTYRVPRDFRDTGSVPIGKPIANTKLYVLDRYLNPLPPGVPGELYIGGDGVAAGYFNQPELTAERFITNPFEDSDSRLYKTGDIVRYLRDGNLEYLGRADNQVKIRGYRIELGEVEAVLAADPAVRQAAVVARQDAGGNQRLIGYVASSHAIPTELRRRLRERLPEYMVPSIFVVLDKLPLTSNGKIDSRALPPPESSNGSRSEHLAPLTEAERKLGEIWSPLLGVSSIQTDDNFFELGGHSLLAVQLVARIKSALNVHVSLRDVFESPTLAGLARCIDTGDREVGSL